MGGRTRWPAASAGVSLAVSIVWVMVTSGRVAKELLTILNKNVSMMHTAAPMRNIQGSALRHDRSSPWIRYEPASTHFRTHNANTLRRGGPVREQEPTSAITRGGSGTALRRSSGRGSVMNAAQPATPGPTWVNRSILVRYRADWPFPRAGRPFLIRVAR